MFIGYAPHDAPRYVAAVVVEHGGGGAEQAAQERRWGLLDTIATADAERIRRGECLRPLTANKRTLIDKVRILGPSTSAFGQ